jgi:formylmethanofuran dehydrogenase subunit D
MKMDNSWECNQNRIILEDIDLDKLGWKYGDYFKVVNIDGRAMLIKAGPLESFIVKGTKTFSDE